jgi:23S rRNA pseudouridine1911/1915/1917 synthase
LRVHLRHLGHPIVADRLYGGRQALARSYLDPALPVRRDSRRPPEITGESDVLICRQALHALRLSFRHPVSDAPLVFEAPLPVDMENTLAALRRTAPKQGR